MIAIPILETGCIIITILSIRRIGGLFRDPWCGDQSVFFLMLAPGYWFAAGHLEYRNLVDVTYAVLASVFYGAVFSYFAMIVDPTARTVKAVVLITLVLSAFYGFSAVVITNTAIDKSAPSIFRAGVIEKIQAGSPSGHGGISYKLRLTPWGPVSGPSTVIVTKQQYDAARLGGIACPNLYVGGLGIRWYRIDACPVEPL